MGNKNFYNRELSWVSFNQRVLQECLDPNVPLYEKIKFMAIFSSNLDEFFRVRVASIRYLLSLKKTSDIKFNPSLLLKEIQSKVTADQETLGKVLRENILPGLKKRQIYLVNDSGILKQHLPYARQYFEKQIEPFIKPIFLTSKQKVKKPFLNNKAIYLAVQLKTLKNKVKYAIVELPISFTGRFIQLPPIQSKKYIIFIDDLIRLFLQEMFPEHKINAIYAIKLTRDAEMYIEDEFSGNLLEKIKVGIKRRKTGKASRFLYDEMMNEECLDFLKDYFKITKEDLVCGGRYHNFNDFFSFPNLSSSRDFDKEQQPLRQKELENSINYFDIIRNKDLILYFPYQRYEYVIQFLQHAANDPLVTEIKITLYRIANPSRVIENLINAARKGKAVTVFVELKARFDEESNIHGANELELAGAKIIYSIPGIKVHSKICLITRAEKNGLKYYAYMATGNFNEKTATIYSDLGVFSTDQKYTNDLNQVFAFLEGRINNPQFENLLVAPFNIRTRFEELVQAEIDNARQGKKAEILLKLNSLQDPKMIKRLYRASQNGVIIKIIVRGICCLIPGIKGLSENIEAKSIIDRYLEHSRVYIFHNNGKPLYFSGSADWMTRNLKRRIEVIFPIFDSKIKNSIKEIINIQWRDNLKARIIDKEQTNEYVTRKPNSLKHRSQHEIYELLKKQQR